MYKEAIGFLNEQLAINANSRPALSLLAYCHYQLQDWDSAIQMYQQLVELYPQMPHYLLQLSQTFYQAALFDEALQTTIALDDLVTSTVQPRSQTTQENGSKGDGSSGSASIGKLINLTSEELEQRTWRLQAAIKYAQGELSAAKTLLDRLDDSSADKAINLACLAYKEGRFEHALTKFQEAQQLDSGFKPDLVYSIALCYYQLRQYQQAIQSIGEIIEKGISHT
jgi:tetratricopeptide repeat protein 30